MRDDIEAKYSKQKQFLLNGLRRAIVEEELHAKEEGARKYRALDMKYGQSDEWSMKELTQGRASLNN